MNREQKVKFIQAKLNHSSTRKADVPKLQHCLEVLKSDDHVLSFEQVKFINDLHSEYQDRNKRYHEKQKAKKEQQLKENVNAAINQE